MFIKVCYFRITPVSPIRRILSKSKAIISRKPEGFGYIAFGISLILFSTKIVSLVKLQLLTTVYGIRSKDLDIFNAANTIPEFIFTIVVIGGINASLIPVLTQTSLKEDDQELKRVFSSIVNIFFLTLFFLCIFVFIFAPQIVEPIIKMKIAGTEAPLSQADIQEFIRLLRILIFSPIILCISSIFSSILQIKKRFFISALSTLFYNIGIIIATLVASLLDRDIEILAFGVILGSILHFVVQLPAIIKSKILYSPWVLVYNDLYVIKAVKQTIPRIIGLTSDYIGNIFQTILALGLATGSLTSFRLAISIREIPTTMFGIAISTSVFPKLSELASQKKLHEFQKLFSQALRSILFWTLPITALLLVLRTPVVRLLFGLFNDSVDFSETRLVSWSLLFLSLGIVFYSVLNLVNRAYYSLDDSKTPTIVSIIVIFFELLLTYALVNLFSHFDDSLTVNPFTIIPNISNYFTKGDSQAAIGGIGLASSISIFVNLWLLTWFLKRKNINLFHEPSFIFKKLISAVVMFCVGLISFKIFEVFFATTKVIGLVFFTFNVTVIMCGSYYFMEKWLKDDDITILDDPIKKFKIGLRKFKKLMKTQEVTNVGA